MKSDNEIIQCENFDFNLISRIPNQKRGRGNPKTKLKKHYKDIICAFDIETTNDLNMMQAYMYVWQFQIGDKTVIGRTWDQFLEFLERIKEQLGENEYLVIFDHNLSFEFQFLSGIYDFTSEEVFAIDRRKVLKCTMMNCFEFRCSYLHSNMSLSMYLDKMGVAHQKEKKYDYDKLRYPWTELTDQELLYCINDVRGLVEAIQIEMTHDHDTLYTFPLTSTGYVRRDAKRAMKYVSHTFIRDQLPDFEIYTLCREAFRGGNTHANRMYAGYILHDVQSADRSSSYPDCQCNDRFPCTHFVQAEENSIQALEELLHRRRACLFRIRLQNVRLLDQSFGCPYIPVDKCRNLSGYVNDNGRILCADSLEITITDIDWSIIQSEYTFTDPKILVLYSARYGKLPRVLVNTTIEYYQKKTELKNVQGKEMEYTKSKNKLNSIYGMMAQDPVKQDIIYEENMFHFGTEESETLLEKSNLRAFLVYSWGVWVTAWARLRLEEGIRIAGQGFVYCDTDSVKYLGTADFRKYNRERIHASSESGAYASDPSGEVHYMGVYEQERSYAEFVALGAKKYAYRYKGDPHCHCTVSGVSKKDGGKELDRRGGLKAFRPALCFTDAGGKELVYNDDPETKILKRGKHSMKITKNVLIKNSSYTLSITDCYDHIININYDTDGYLLEYTGYYEI